MEKLLIPIIVVSPIFLIIAIYRLWQIFKKKLSFKNKSLEIIYTLFLITIILGYIYIGWFFFKCVWPYQCGEGFTSGYAAAGVLFGDGIVSIGFIISEIIRAVSLKNSSSSKN